MLRRDWRRIYSLHGFRPFGLLLTVLLAVVVIVDQFAGDYADLDDQRSQLDREVRTMRQKVGQQKQIETALQNNQAKLESMAGRGFAAPQAQTAAADMAGALDKWLVSLGMSSRGTSPQNPETRGEVVYLPQSASMTFLPQHLVRLLQQIQGAPFAVRLVEIDLKVSDPETPSGLEAQARFEGVYLPPRNPQSGPGLAGAGLSRPSIERGMR